MWMLLNDSDVVFEAVLLGNAGFSAAPWHLCHSEGREILGQGSGTSVLGLWILVRLFKMNQHPRHRKAAPCQ